jgi:P2 family phage major capsid protein
MQNSTRALFKAYLAQVATLNGVPVESLDKKFTVDPTVEQKLETKIQESSDFLSKINMYGVRDQEGEKVGLGVSGTIASTTDTNTKDRATADMAAIDAMRYRCEQTNFDTHLRYQQIDAWAKFADFQTRLRDAILRRSALDRICIGFNGVSRAATSDRAAHPLLQDVNKGWLQAYREKAASRVLPAQEVGADKEYKNLDALVFDMINSLIDPWHRESPDLVVICGRELVTEKYFPVINNANNQSNTERVAADVILSSQRIGGRPAVSVPYFPANALMVTPLANLSIYWQEGTRRRTVLDNAKRDRIENYESVNEGYVVEDFGAGCVAEGIVIA